MLFNSFSFLFLFLPAALLAWYVPARLGRKQLSRVLLSAAGLFFIGSFSLHALLVFSLQALFAYAGSFAAARAKTAGSRYAYLSAGVLLGVLALFKYGSAFSAGKWLLMPVGISFYTFSFILFAADRALYERTEGAERRGCPHPGFLDYLLFASFFPKFAEGPIAHYEEVHDSLEHSLAAPFSAEKFLRGFSLFAMGMGKKLLLSDPLQKAVAFGFGSCYLTDTLTALLTITCYCFQLYFDFSGYLDMACGIAWMFGADLPRNFDRPFAAVSFAEFWKRWHMTLTLFFTRFVYIPLGGSRKGTFRTFLHVVLVFLLSGLWHGTGMTYLLWGLSSGLLVFAARYLPGLPQGTAEDRLTLSVFLRRVLNFFTFGFTLVFFRSETAEKAFAFLRRTFYFTWPGFVFRLGSNYGTPETYLLQKVTDLAKPELTQLLSLLLLLLHLLVCTVLVNGKDDARGIAEKMALTKRNGILTGILFVWCLLSFSGVSTYLYFQY